MVALLKEYVDTFTWSCQDMPGSDTDVVVHKLPWKGDCPLKKQNAAKSQTEEGHLADRGKSVDWWRQFTLRLNSDKCTIRVRAGCSPTETVYADSYHFVDFKMDLIRKQSRGVLSDYIAPQPIEDDQPMKFEFPDEDISRCSNRKIESNRSRRRGLTLNPNGF
ncbi:hypothetical protein KIW84_070516 [Lathyrus oleraceus]|uniref:Uncharacterized protein n=1 Tax=Pisum sativum TaxID=3888 RepID=A0A9D4VGX6_PEA|nr:hypothetical protein KIW84_070516 [Pisum sativum]